MKKKLVPWNSLEGRRIILGGIGVDSASVAIGDAVCVSIQTFTPDGDGTFPVYAQIVNGRRCLVIDFDAAWDHERGCLRKIPVDWKCPDCGAGEASCASSPTESDIVCENNHTHYVAHLRIDDGFVDGTAEDEI